MTLCRTPDTKVNGPLTMLDIERVIERHRDALVQHPFMVRLEGPGTIEQFRRMLPRHAFFTLVFQDVLRLERDKCEDPQIREIARKHELEDKGHDLWYLDDLSRLGVALDIRWMFSAEHELARDVGYALVSQVLSAGDDRSRLSVVLSLEAIGREFFVRVPGFAERLGVARGLKYFAVRHLDIERSHDVFRNDGQRYLAAIAVHDHVVPEVLNSIERTFELMARLADDLDAALCGADGKPASPARES
ncbi:MAG: hypothetical protein WBY94_06485 [Polyangiaceae bacterium]